MRIIFSMALEVPTEVCNFEYLIEQFYELLLHVSRSSISLQNAIAEELLVLYHIVYEVKLTNPRNRVYDFTRLYQPYIKETKAPELQTAKLELIELAFVLLQPYAEEVFTENIFEKKGQLKNVLSTMIKSVPQLPETTIQRSTKAKILISKNYFASEDTTSTRKDLCEIRNKHSEKESLYGKLYQYYGYCLFDIKEEYLLPSEDANFIEEFLEDDFYNMIHSLEIAIGCYPGNHNTWTRLGLCYFYLSIALSDLQDTYRKEQFAAQIKCADKQEESTYALVLENIRHKALQCLFVSNTIQENTTAMYYTALLLFDQIQFEKFKSLRNLDVIRDLCHRGQSLLSKCIEKEPKNSNYLLLNGWLLEEDRNRAIRCLELYEKAVHLKTTSATLFELQNSLLALLRQHGSEFIPLVQRYTRKVSVESFSGLAEELYTNIITPMVKNGVEETNETKAWTDVTLGFLECINKDECYKSLYKLAECCCYGPWKNWNGAQEVMSKLLKPRAVRDGKPIGFNYNFKASSQKQLVTMGKNFRLWRYKSTIFYIEILKNCRNLDLFSIICTGLRRSYIKEAPELFDAYRIALNSYVEILWSIYNETPNKQDLEKMKFLRYVHELCIYFNDKSVKGKNGFTEHATKIFELRTKVTDGDVKNPSSSLEWKQFIQKTKDLFGLDFSAPANAAGKEVEITTPVYHSEHDSKLFDNIQETDVFELVNSQREETEMLDEDVDDKIHPTMIEGEEEEEEEGYPEAYINNSTSVENPEGDNDDSIDLNISSQHIQTIVPINMELSTTVPQEEISNEEVDEEMEEIDEEQSVTTSEREFSSHIKNDKEREDSVIDLDDSPDEGEDDDELEEDDIILISEKKGGHSIVDLSDEEDL